MFGVNQAPCCDGETAENSPAPTAQIAFAPRADLARSRG
jgi:hypothetical protein